MKLLLHTCVVFFGTFACVQIFRMLLKWFYFQRRFHSNREGNAQPGKWRGCADRKSQNQPIYPYFFLNINSYLDFSTFLRVFDSIIIRSPIQITWDLQRFLMVLRQILMNLVKLMGKIYPYLHILQGKPTHIVCASPNSLYRECPIHLHPQTSRNRLFCSLCWSVGL